LLDLFITQAIADTIATVAPIVPAIPVVDPEAVTNAPEWISTALTIVIGLLGLLGLGGAYLSSKIDTLKKEIIELFTVISVSIKDGKVTPEEVNSIIKEAKDVVKSIKSSEQQ